MSTEEDLIKAILNQFNHNDLIDHIISFQNEEIAFYKKQLINNQVFVKTTSDKISKSEAQAEVKRYKTAIKQRKDLIKLFEKAKSLTKKLSDPIMFVD